MVIPKYLPPVALFLSTTSLSADIITLTERTRLSNHDDISFFLRMPSGWAGEVERDFFGNRKASVKGVLMICTHRSDPEEVKAILSDNSGFQHFIRFADEHNLALVTWTNLRGYVTHTSGDEMDDQEYREYDRNFNARSREWESGYRRLANRYHLPRENIPLYGISGGGQQAHRLALRKPEYFAGIHIHVNSSYDVPTRDANGVLWLVTTGTREYGYPAGERFYRQALELGYHMIFKAGENLGHSTSPEIRNLGMRFFEYCLNFIPDATDPDWKAPPKDKFYFMVSTQLGHLFSVALLC